MSDAWTFSSGPYPEPLTLKDLKALLPPRPLRGTWLRVSELCPDGKLFRMLAGENWGPEVERDDHIYVLSPATYRDTFPDSEIPLGLIRIGLAPEPKPGAPGWDAVLRQAL